MDGKRRREAVAAACCLVGLATAACGQGVVAPPPTPADLPAVVPAAPAASQPAPGAQTGASATPPAGAARPAAATAQVCRTEAVTGSRFGRRVCRSAVQTDEDRAASREMLRQMQGARVPPSG